MTKVNRQDLRGFRRRRSKTGNRKFHKSSNAISKALSKYTASFKKGIVNFNLTIKITHCQGFISLNPPLLHCKVKQMVLKNKFSFV